MTKYILLAMSLFVTQVYAVDDGDLRPQFKWSAAIDGDVEAGQLYRIQTPNDVFDGSKSFPRDLRVYDKEGQQWPYFIWQPKEKVVIGHIASEKLNASVVEGSDRYYRQDLRVAADASEGGRARHSEIQIDTSGHGYMRKVELYGSEDQSTWARVGMGYLVHYSRDANVRNSTISYPVADYPFMQVRVYPNARDASEEFEIRRITLRHRETKPAEYEEAPLKRLTLDVEEIKRGWQTLMLDLQASRRPIEKLVFSMEDREHARAIKVYGRNDLEATWRWIADGEVHQLDGHVRDTILLNHARYRYLKVDLYHHDDEPLKVVDVTARAIPRYIVFEAQEGTTPVLFFGADHVAQPRYDIQRRKGEKEAASAPLVSLAPRAANEGLMAQGWGDLGQWIAVSVVGLVSVYVIWIIVGMMREQSTGRET